MLALSCINSCSFFCNSKVTVSLGYMDLVSTLPSEISVLAWPLHQPKRLRTGISPITKHQLVPARLFNAEDALRTLSLPQGRNRIWNFQGLLKRSTHNTHTKLGSIAHLVSYLLGVCNYSCI